MKVFEKRKVVLVGTGFVGMAMAYSLVNTGGIDELVLIDIDKQRAIGEAMDLNHGLPYRPHSMEIKAGDYSEVKDAQIVVITAGANQKPGQSRLELTQVNSKIMEDITHNIMNNGFNGIIIVASNPVDIMTKVVYETSKLPSNQVLGTGTILDSARLKYYLAKELDVSAQDVNAYILGEHGDSSFVPWMNCYIGCKSLMEYVIEKGIDMNRLHDIYKDVRDSAAMIIERKKATYYGIGVSLNRIIQSIFNDEKAVLCVSTLQNNEYGHSNVFFGVPTIIDQQGVREIIKLPLNDNDCQKLAKSVEILNQF